VLSYITDTTGPMISPEMQEPVHEHQAWWWFVADDEVALDIGDGGWVERPALSYASRMLIDGWIS
jgi:hypothetical protein